VRIGVAREAMGEVWLNRPVGTVLLILSEKTNLRGLTDNHLGLRSM